MLDVTRTVAGELQVEEIIVADGTNDIEHGRQPTSNRQVDAGDPRWDGQTGVGDNQQIGVTHARDNPGERMLQQAALFHTALPRTGRSLAS